MPKEKTTPVGPAIDQKLFDKVQNVVINQLGTSKDAAHMGASIMEDLGADSLDNVELIMAFEEEFEITIPEEDAERLKKVSDFYYYIRDHKERK